MSSAAALTLRALGALSTRQVAQAFSVPEVTTAQRTSRAKRAVAGVRLDAPGDLAGVARVLHLMLNEGCGGAVDLADLADEPEVGGLLALLLLHHARRDARARDDGTLVPLPAQDRSLWRTDLVAEGVGILQRALVRDRLGGYQAQAAIAALHADARSAEQTDRARTRQWYDELSAHLHERAGDLGAAVALYREAAATRVAERDHLVLQAARVRQEL